MWGKIIFSSEDFAPFYKILKRRIIILNKMFVNVGERVSGPSSQNVVDFSNFDVQNPSMLLQKSLGWMFIIQFDIDYNGFL